MGMIPKCNHMETFRLPLSFHEDKRARCNETAVFAVGLEMTKSARGLRGHSGAMNHSPIDSHSSLKLFRVAVTKTAAFLHYGTRGKSKPESS